MRPLVDFNRHTISIDQNNFSQVFINFHVIQYSIMLSIVILFTFVNLSFQCTVTLLTKEEEISMQLIFKG
jgi:hypothetical protein